MAASASTSDSAQQSHCCVVGGGPGGAMLAFLLARKGVPVTLLEAHRDFDRDFRGDTIHPSVLEVLDQLGLVDQLLELPHHKVDRVTLPGVDVEARFEGLPVKHPFVMMMPQAQFLEFLTAEATARYPHFRLVMGVRVEQLVIEDGVVCGVRYRTDDGSQELRAALTVGADGRFSKIRQLAGLELQKVASPIDVLWFKLPRFPTDPSGLGGGGNYGYILVRLDRGDHWQAGFIIPKGSYQRFRSEGLEALRAAMAAAEPLVADRVEHLQDWRQVAMLSVEIGRVRRWFRPGLLLIGDAAHVMSPLGGVGINYAIMDAVAAAERLAEPLKRGAPSEADLASVQRRREWPARFVQSFQAVAQRQLLEKTLRSRRPLRAPWFMRFAFFRRMLIRFVGLGIRPETLKD